MLSSSAASRRSRLNNIIMRGGKQRGFPTRDYVGIIPGYYRRMEFTRYKPPVCFRKWTILHHLMHLFCTSLKHFFVFNRILNWLSAQAKKFFQWDKLGNLSDYLPKVKSKLHKTIALLGDRKTFLDLWH